MDDPEGTYAPESPDFSAYSASYAQDPTSYQRHVSSTRNSGHNPIAYHLHQQQPQARTYAGNDLGDVQMDDASGPRSSRRQKAKASSSAAGIPQRNVEVKTKFPVARIKRIMQADEDVGKVSQATPIAVCMSSIPSHFSLFSLCIYGLKSQLIKFQTAAKALELFMISLVSKAAEEARLKSSKRITAEHLKRAVAKEEEYDFLQEIISKVPDAPATNEKTDNATDREGSRRTRNGGGGGGGGRRRKKNGDDSS